MSKKMPWTVAMEEVLADGDWHLIEDVLKIGMEEISSERALVEMKSRSLQSSEETRIGSGRRTLANQTLMSFVRFGTAKYSNDKKRVQKTSPKATNPGELVQRVERLEQLCESLMTAVVESGIPVSMSIESGGDVE